MNYLIVENYINKLTKENINNYCKKQGIILLENELDLIYLTIKKDYKLILSKQIDKVFYNLKNNLRSFVYDKIIQLYNQYKDKF